MAEILGTVSGGLGIANTAVKLSRFIRTLRNAPREFLFLSREIEGLHFVFTEAEKADHGRDIMDSNLTGVLQRANTIVFELQSFIDVMQIEATSIVRRVKWIRQKNRAKDLLKELQGVRRDLDTLLAVNTM